MHSLGTGSATMPAQRMDIGQQQNRHGKSARRRWLYATLLLALMALDSFQTSYAEPTAVHKSPRPLPKWKRPKPPRPLPKWKRRPPPPPPLEDEARYASWESSERSSQEESSEDSTLSPPSPMDSPPFSPRPPSTPNPKPPSPPRPSEPIMDVWVQAGGSNTWGDNGFWDADRVQDPPCTQTRPGLIKMWSWGEQSWTDAFKNIHGVARNNGTPSNTVGPDIPFARALLDLGLAEKVGFVPCALGGTNMFWNWAPTSHDQYDLMVNQTRAAMQRIGKRGRLAGMIMMLGEGDAMKIYNSDSTYNPSGAVWSVYFGRLMQAMIEQFRSDVREFNSNLPVIIALQAVKGRQRVFPYIESIRNQIIALNMPNLLKAEMEGCRIYQVDLSNLNGWLGIEAWVGWQGIHLSRVGQCCMGQRMAVSYALNLPNLLDQRLNPRVPSVLPAKDNGLITQFESWPDGPSEPPSPPPGGAPQVPPPPTPPIPPPPPPPSSPNAPFAPWMSGVFNFPLANHAKLDISTAEAVSHQVDASGEKETPGTAGDTPT